MTAASRPPGTAAKTRRATRDAPASGRRPARRGYNGLSAEELLAQRRRRLLEAGLELFATRGYHRTPIELLCAEARVTTRHFYEAFGGREALLLAVYEDVIRHAQRMIAEALRDPDADADAAIEAAIDAFMRAYTDDPRRARIACIEVVGVSAAVADRRDAVIQEFAGMLRQYADDLVRRGRLPARNYALAGVAMAGAVNELLCAWLRAPQALGLDALTAEILMLFRAVILGARQLG